MDIEIISKVGSSNSCCQTSEYLTNGAAPDETPIPTIGAEGYRAVMESTAR